MGLIRRTVEKEEAMAQDKTTNGKAGGTALGAYIDHTVLKPDTTKETLKRFCDEAVEHGFAAVCVNSGNVGYVAEQLEGSGVRACAVVGFPLGAVITDVKAAEAGLSLDAGALDIDMVADVGAAKDGDWEAVYADIKAVADVVHAKEGAVLKVIIETCLLTDSEKREMSLAAKRAGADFVKTSTGYSSGGATVGDVRLNREAVGPDMGIKASTGIRTYEDAVRLIRAGATRLGTSSGIAIIAGGPPER
jgi:deoxyribose-phosphate aldolase